MKFIQFALRAIAFAAWAAAGSTHAQGTAFTYQGRLTEFGNPVNAVYEMQFTLFDAITNGSVVGTRVFIAPLPVTNGLFTVTLDFGANAFSGGTRWLEMTVNLFGSAMVPM